MNNKHVLITGCTSGIGLELAKIFAENNYNLILVSRNLTKLQNLQNDLLAKYNISINIIAQDLSLINSARNVYDKVHELNIQVDILCNNAGSGLFGEFLDYDISRYHDMVQLNITSLMDLTYYFLNDMKKRNCGKILNIASTAAFSSGPYMAVYYATKAFVLSFSEALSMELKNTNINVTCICPGTTKTEFFDKATSNTINLIRNKAMSSHDVAKYSFNKLMKKKIVGIPGFKNRLVIFGNKFISRRLSRNIIYSYQRKRGKGKI